MDNISASYPNPSISYANAERLLQIAASILERPLQALIQEPAAGAGIILNPLLTRRTEAPPMDLNLNQLLNGATLQAAAKQLPPELLAKPQVIEALVLNATLLARPATTAPGTPTTPAPLPQTPLPTSAGGTPAAAGDAAQQALGYRINLQWQGRVLQVLSQQPMTPGSRVQLQVNERGEILLLPNAATRATTAAPAAAPVVATPAAAQPPAAAAAAANTQTLQQALRENLPRQQPLHQLVPVLQKLVEPALRGQLPAPVLKAVVQLLRAVPKPEQLQNAEGLKRALRDSGSLLEARAARATAPGGAAPGGGDGRVEALPRVLAGDVKSQILQLFTLLRQLGLTAPATTPTAHSAAGADADTLVYNFKSPQARAGTAPPPRADAGDSAEQLLSQLGKLLQAGLARIQLHQLDSVVTRQPAGADTAALVPAWVFELPLQTPRGADNLQLRFEQHRRQHEGAARIQWTVQLAFDLHALGKLAATLTVLGREVAATLWSERAHTHRAVQNEVDVLRAGLESVGVKVTEVQCRLGLPPERSALFAQQLVDVHT